jgi:hypothetical protein
MDSLSTDFIIVLVYVVECMLCYGTYRMFPNEVCTDESRLPSTEQRQRSLRIH